MMRENLWARLASMIFHPMILPSLAIIVLLAIPSYVSFSIPPQARRLITGLVFINTCVGPFLVILLMKRIGLISDLILSNRSERLYPILVSVMFYFFTWYLFRQSNLPSLMIFFVIGATSLILAGLIITTFWKISLHMISIGGFTGYMIALSITLGYEMPLLITGSILMSGMLGSARIKLNAHNPPQVYVGWITGIVIMLLVMFYLRG